MKIAAIIVTYNRKEILLECIEALQKQTKYNMLDIIVIDNNSTDGTKCSLEYYINNNIIRYVNTGSNLGGAGGFQFGMNYVIQYDYDYIWIMDDDCIPTETALEAFLNAEKNIKSPYGFMSSKVLWKDNSICKMNIQRKSLWKNVKDWDKPIVPIIMASFVSFFIPVKIVKEVGLPIKEFFIWTDDWEYSRRISRKYKCYLINDSVVVHKSKNNYGADISSESNERLNRYEYLYRNDVYLYRREGIEGGAYEILRLTFHILKVLLNSKDNKFLRISKIIKGTVAGITFYPPILYKDSIRK